MKKIQFTKHVMPHLLAVLVFLLVTIFFFGPVFFENRAINQHDITQSLGASKALDDFRSETGEEGLWTPSMFSGMPAYLVDVRWGNDVVLLLKQVISLGLTHPVCNIYLAFLSYYIMLLAFGVRPYLAIAGALAFGLSSYMIVGLAAGHNARIGAIAFMPLVIAGIHLVFTDRKILGFGITSAGLALHLRENHLQITYYLLLIVLVYGLVQLIIALKEKRIMPLLKNVALLIPAGVLAVGTFFGPLWSIMEYSAYTIRGKSELVKGGVEPTDGLRKDYAFEYSNGLMEPLTLVVPNLYGGSSMENLFDDESSEVRKALAQQGIPYDARQMAHPSYWGSQPLSAPYYGGAIVFLLFIMGIVFAEKKYVWWLVSLSLLAIVLSWGKNFASFNYFMLDYFPGYNKFRSVTFAIIITLFAMPLLGMLGFERLMKEGLSKESKKKLLVVFGVAGGFCVLLILGAGMFSFLKSNESELPAWFLQAVRDERRSLLRADAFRSLLFMTVSFALIYFELFKKISAPGFYALIIFLIMIDLAVVDKRYFNKDNYVRKSRNAIPMSAGDQQVLNDKGYYRVMNLNGTMSDALTSYYHNSIGGYHGAKIRRYQDLYDSCLSSEVEMFVTEAQEGRFDFAKYPVLNMLNTKYILYGQNRENVIPNPRANGPAWFVREVKKVKSPTEELAATCLLDSKTQAVIDESNINVPEIQFDSSSTISLVSSKPNRMSYQSSSSVASLAVFSEIYYPHGWQATVDGKEAEIIRCNYVLRSLVLPAGEHAIEFTFKPKVYAIGNPITTVSSWLMIGVLLLCLGWTLKNEKAHA